MEMGTSLPARAKRAPGLGQGMVLLLMHPSSHPVLVEAVAQVLIGEEDTVTPRHQQTGVCPVIK